MMNETDWTRVELFRCLNSFTESDWIVRFKVKLILYGLIADLLSHKVSQPELVHLVNSVSQFLNLSLLVELPSLLIHPQSLLNLFLLCKLNHLLSLPLNLLYWLIQSPSPRSFSYFFFHCNLGFAHSPIISIGLRIPLPLSSPSFLIILPSQPLATCQINPKEDLKSFLSNPVDSGFIKLTICICIFVFTEFEVSSLRWGLMTVTSWIWRPRLPTQYGMTRMGR